MSGLSRGCRGVFVAQLALLLGLVLTSVQALAACVDPTGGIGGTGVTLEGDGRGGIGGTGALPSEDGRGGIGGTGLHPGAGPVGILGTVTGFGSVCLNGLEVEYEAEVPTFAQGAPTSTMALAVGQVLAIEADWLPAGLSARRIHVRYAVQGPVTARSASDGRIEVAGQVVRVTPETRLGGVNAIEALKPGRHVRVSGLRDERSEIIASRIDAIDEVVPAHGDADPLFSDRVRQVSIEGYVESRSQADALRIGGFEVTTGAVPDAATLAIGNRVIVTGRIGPDRRIVATHIEIRQPGSGGPHGHGQPAAQGRGGGPGNGPGRQDGAPHHGIGPVDRPERPGRFERPERPGRRGGNG